MIGFLRALLARRRRPEPRVVNVGYGSWTLGDDGQWTFTRRDPADEASPIDELRKRGVL